MSKQCEIDGCESQAVGRKWCLLHYWRWKRNGDPLIVTRAWRRWTAAEDAVLRAAIPADGSRAPRGTLGRLAAELDRSPNAVSMRLGELRRLAA